MKINGIEAVDYLSKISERVTLFDKDNTDKFWCYKLKSAKKTEFAFDPKTKTGLFVRVDKMPPTLPGITAIERIAGKDVSTALGRVFSGGLHKANFSCTIESEEALLSFITYYESL
ncbi:hypothetical protein A3742_09065 [Oleiphilus sp. HI0071]|uniref:hypothetical protein n=1 Tax=Oleiphilus sp. HI0080 TaxID=1822255 RepID=UPI0007C31BE8|nr:hypothetical protein [Oleiphilus sp. HI0080]KZY60184.1 hypothetical protein A3737_07145 [Oleiphilus sp. HI0065]KZY82497.1 hypothetical protein A3742_09065 [Oleiphilus sp. HI0071]KZY90153.1 hypothetical protein A3744_05910 [Oleiphilus sp. HI0073]KZZ49670.1 hypothetical protein A3760_14850 [Oleiphilus sp. HI0122]KZY65818.1 hypothetical protein A3737_17570 [Oleiphilus sp. HI0065]